MSELNIYQRMLKITEEIQTVAKTLNVQVTQKSSYKAVSEKDILDAVKPIEIKYGVYSFPVHREVIETAVIESESQYGPKKQLFMRLEILYRFVNIDKPEEYIDITSYGDGIDTGDKAPGKAMTYGDKYALMKAYKISTGDDPDQEASEPLKGKSETQQKSKKAAVATEKQVSMIKTLYSEADINKMLANLNVGALEQITVEQASKMIAARKGK